LFVVLVGTVAVFRITVAVFLVETKLSVFFVFIGVTVNCLCDERSFLVEVSKGLDGAFFVEVSKGLDGEIVIRFGIFSEIGNELIGEITIRFDFSDDLMDGFTSNVFVFTI
jgi:hypothetical protein